MIRDEDTLEVRWVPLDAIQWDDQPIDPAQVQFYAGMLATRPGHLSPPVLNPDLTVRDGRHRLRGHEVAGRHRARCLIVHPQPANKESVNL